MSKCMLCNKKIKFSRNCLVLNEIICSTCCGTKRELEIKCTGDCKYLIEGQIKVNNKQIMQLVKSKFNREEEDIYQDDKILELVLPFEQFLFYNYYNDINFTDDFMTEFSTKLFYSLEEKGSIYIFNETETELFDEFSRIAEKTKMPIESQKLIILRIMKSVDNMTGGAFGNRMYLELLRNHFTGTGVVAEVMGKK